MFLQIIPDHDIPTYLKKSTIPDLFSVIIFVFKKYMTVFTTNKCEKCPSSIQCWDFNPRHYEHESPPRATRPRLPPNILTYYFFTYFRWDVHELIVVLPARAYRFRASIRWPPGWNLRVASSGLYVGGLHWRQVLRHDVQRVLQVRAASVVICSNSFP